MKTFLELSYRYRGVAMAPIYLMLVTVFTGETERDAWIWPIGLTVFFLGVLIRVWAQTHLHYRLAVRKVLTTTGPYLFIRNPIYVANTLMLLGVTILSELLWLLPVMFLWCAFVYSLVVRREERHLTEKYGEPYIAFMKDVPRWIPRRASRRECGFAWQFLRKSLFAEAHCLLLLLPLIGKEWLWNMGS